MNRQNRREWIDIRECREWMLLAKIVVVWYKGKAKRSSRRIYSRPESAPTLFCKRNWEYSSVGRAFALQARGLEFESQYFQSYMARKTFSWMQGLFIRAGSGMNSSFEGSTVWQFFHLSAGMFYVLQFCFIKFSLPYTIQHRWHSRICSGQHIPSGKELGKILAYLR